MRNMVRARKMGFERRGSMSDGVRSTVAPPDAASLSARPVPGNDAEHPGDVRGDARLTGRHSCLTIVTGLPIFGHSAATPARPFSEPGQT